MLPPVVFHSLRLDGVDTLLLSAKTSKYQQYTLRLTLLRIVPLQ